MNFIVIRYYIEVCKIINIKPSFRGLKEFNKFYKWECEKDGE